MKFNKSLSVYVYVAIATADLNNSDITMISIDGLNTYIHPLVSSRNIYDFRLRVESVVAAING